MAFARRTGFKIISVADLIASPAAGGLVEPAAVRLDTAIGGPGLCVCAFVR
jgi:hypothetical protein